MTAPGPLSAERRRGRLRALPLRVTLVIALVALVALGLLASGVAATTQLSGFLSDRTDAQLQGASALRGSTGFGGGGGGGGGADNGYRPPSRFYVALSSTDGTLARIFSDPTPVGSAPPHLPAPTSAQLVSEQPYTVTATNGGQWRAVSRLTPTGTEFLTTAVPLADDRAAIARLEQVLLIIGAAVLLLLGGLTYLVVRQSLRPLTEVELTAAAIAAGDLDRRVPEGGPGTEVGRLALALNGMLAQIQTAFDASAESARRATASEQKIDRKSVV